MRLLLVLAVAALVAGCVAVPEPTPSAGTGRAPSFKPPVVVSTEWPGAEPVIVVASDGTILIEGVGRATRANGPVGSNVNKVFRSQDVGATWEDVTPIGPGQEASFDGFLAIGHSDTVYAVNVFAVTFALYRSDDLGTTWTRVPVPYYPPLMHRNWVIPVKDATLHVAMEMLPPSFAAGDTPPNPQEGMWYLRSDDRGATWSTPVQIDPIVNYAGQSNLVADASGDRLYVMRYEEDSPPNAPRYEDGRFYLVASEDGGATWERHEAMPLAGEIASALTSLTIDSAGTLYFAWAQEARGQSRVHLAASKDGGATWSAPVTIADDDRATRAMPWILARAPGELGVMWYAADAAGTALEVDADWFVDYALVSGADTPTPAAAVTRVTPDRVHAGNVCARGPACGPGEDRSLLDYPWIAWGPDGRAHLAFASTEWERPSAFPMYAAETSVVGHGPTTS